MSKDYKIEGRPATIFRVVKNKENPYVMVDRRPIDNPALSFKAKGILTYLMSRPDGWEVSVTDLVKHGTDGEASIRAGLKELREAGHMRYTTSRKEGRITGWLIEVYEVPSPDCDFQQVENLQVENQDVENRGQVLNTSNSTESIINDDDDTTRPNIFSLYEQTVGIIVPMMADELRAAEKDYPAEWLPEAFAIAAKNNARRWNYIKAVLDGWKRNGKDWKPGDKNNAAAKPDKMARTVDMLNKWLEGDNDGN